MNARLVLIGFASSALVVFAAQAGTAADEARMIEIMERMDAASAKLASMESSMLARQEEIGAAVGLILATEAGLSNDLVTGREAEFGRAVTNLVRTFQMTASYEHRANDALVKRDLEWLQFLMDMDLMEEAVAHDIAIKTPLFQRRGEWIRKTGNAAMALDSMTDISCFRDMVVANGFTKTALQMTYVSPYKEVLAAGTKRGMFTITEQEIHEQFTTPTLQGYAEVLGVDVNISPWNDDRIITISVLPIEQAAEPLQAATQPAN
jgi:hypothetical protein